MPAIIVVVTAVMIVVTAVWMALISVGIGMEIDGFVVVMMLLVRFFMMVVFVFVVLIGVVMVLIGVVMVLIGVAMVLIGVVMVFIVMVMMVGRILMAASAVAIVNKVIERQNRRTPRSLAPLSRWQQSLPSSLRIPRILLHFLFIVIVYMVKHLLQHFDHIFFIGGIVLHVRVPHEIGQLARDYHCFRRLVA